MSYTYSKDILQTSLRSWLRKALGKENQYFVMSEGTVSI